MDSIQPVLNNKTYQPNALNELPTIEDKVSDAVCNKYGFFYTFNNFLKTKEIIAENNAKYQRNYYKLNKKELLLKRKSKYKINKKNPTKKIQQKETCVKNLKTKVLKLKICQIVKYTI